MGRRGGGSDSIFLLAFDFQIFVSLELKVQIIFNFHIYISCDKGLSNKTYFEYILMIFKNFVKFQMLKLDTKNDKNSRFQKTKLKMWCALMRN